MTNKLLTRVVTKLVNEQAVAKEYGVSLVNIPDFNYNEFVCGLNSVRKIQIFFLGLSPEQRLALEFPDVGDKVEYFFTVEEAEVSRNSGKDEIFRVHIIKRAEMEKISSLRWFPEITIEQIYIKSCELVRKELASTNIVIVTLLQALKCKPIRSILSFERVLGYLELLLEEGARDNPAVIKDNFYKLGLCADKNIDGKNPSKEDFIRRIRRNHELVERLGNLEQSERQGITFYYSKNNINKEMPRLILDYYESRNIELLKKMEFEEVEICLKTAKKSTAAAPVRGKESGIKPTALAIQLAFDNKQEQICDMLRQIGRDIDDDFGSKRSGRHDVEFNDIKLRLYTEPITEIIASDIVSEEILGGIIRAEVKSPYEAIRDKGKYKLELFTEAYYYESLLSDLNKISNLLDEGEKISLSLKDFLVARKKLVPYSKRLQDAPMLQVLAEFTVFAEYLKAYEKLLNSINEDFHKIWDISSSKAKEIINNIISIDYVFIVGKAKLHVIPTPLHPLYLWKYIELAKEIFSSRSVDELEECHLTDEDKAFIIRKADDIPDPLSVVLMPVTIDKNGPVFLPLSGRLGLLPVYSNQPQINQSENGVDTLKQQIIRYLCLYPHAGMMLKLAVIDPPSVEVVVSMLKTLNKDKEFNISGIEVNIYRTKETPGDWIEIEDESFNDGILKRSKSRQGLNFKLKISNKGLEYTQILSELPQQHILVVFDPNEVKLETAQNNKLIRLHPLCVPKIYKYDPVDERVEIRPASEGGIFTIYSSILEKLNEQPSAFSHTGAFFLTPLKKETYEGFLKRADWLIILDQSLKSWDISLRAASEKLFYREDSYRSIGIYSSNCRKFIVGYDTLIKQLGNFIPKEEGIKNIINSIRDVNNDGLLSIVSHTSNRIFDTNHGKGSLGIAIAALKYKSLFPNAILVGLDTQLAHEWLSERIDGRLPDLIGIRLEDGNNASIDIIEVKTYCNNINSFIITNDRICGYAVEQTAILEELIKEMFSATEKITTISRREILREQVFESLFQAELDQKTKLKYSNNLNELFAGEYKLIINKNIYFVDFENSGSTSKAYMGKTDSDFANQVFCLTTIGSNEIQALFSGLRYETAKDNPVSESLVNSDGKIHQVISSINHVENAVCDIDNLRNVGAEKMKELEEQCARINKILRDYKINAYPVKVENVQEAVRFTRFSVELKSGESIRSIERYKADIGRQMEANGDILINHVKGTKYISIDIPFAGNTGAIPLREQLYFLNESQGKLDILAGQLADGSFEIIDLAAAPHMLIAGTTGSGKTIFLHSIIVSLLYKYSADELQLLIIDPKQTDFVFFENISHLYGNRIVCDPDEALDCLKNLNIKEKEARTAALRACRSKDIDSYNNKNQNNKMKRLVVIIDEYSDLIHAAEIKGIRKEFEKTLLMLIQRVRNLGIHLIIATQRPSVQIITGALKAVIPYRASFKLPSHIDSQTILDMPGAENLLGKGDMLMVTDSENKRMQGLYISEEELEELLLNYKGD